MNKFFPSGIQTQNNNIDSQTFDPNLTHNVSMVSGFDGTHENLAIVDQSGNLHVNSAASSYLHYESHMINVTAAYTPVVNVSFSHPVSLVFIYCWTGGPVLAFVDTTTGQLGNPFGLTTGIFNFPITTTGIALYSNTSGTDVGCWIVGYY